MGNSEEMQTAIVQAATAAVRAMREANYIPEEAYKKNTACNTSQTNNDSACIQLEGT